MTIEFNNFGSNRAENLRRNGDKPVKLDTSVTSDKDTSAAMPSPADSVSLSNAAKNLAQLESELKGLPEVDMQRVEAIRSMLADGSYKIDLEKLAQKMLDLES